MKQLALFSARPSVVSVTRLLWEAAGCPVDTTGKDGEVDAFRTSERCWWCGLPSPGWGRPRSILPATFPFPLEAAAPASEVLCICCGWTLCDRIRLPKALALDRIRSKAEQGRRQIVSVAGGPPERWLALELADGQVGLWSCAGNTRDEEPWIAARAELRETPRTVGPCEYMGSRSYDELDSGPVEKFRSFHHLAARGDWRPRTDSDRMEIRDWLLSPPPAPWVAVIGDGKKHHAISAQLLGAVTRESDTCCAYYQGSAVWYRPSELADLVAAIESLITAGAGDDEIREGTYAPRGLPLLLALRQAEPVVDVHRGGPALELALYLRRNRKELANAA